MISRRERKVQEALGLKDDIPPTIPQRIRGWIWYTWMIRLNMCKHLDKHVIWQKIAFRLPKILAYHMVIRVWAHATTCTAGHNDCPDDVTWDVALERWEKEPRG